jgi:hypothetical protein
VKVFDFGLKLNWRVHCGSCLSRRPVQGLETANECLPQQRPDGRVHEA